MNDVHKVGFAKLTLLCLHHVSSCVCHYQGVQYNLGTSTCNKLDTGPDGPQHIGNTEKVDG